ncbi:MAG TPA: plasmid pRiA4b ORF-3 family protein [Methanosarcina sp.]|nr:plasmid pRiA4b ORF-3 family protein [Methanosarcina sp.]
MKKTFENVYQLKLSMKGIIPRIWRQVQVPENYTFLELHKVIQASMTWENYYLHEFEISNPKTGKPEIITAGGDDFKYSGKEPPVPEDNARLSDYLTLENNNALYTYNFGDNWQVEILLENILPRRKKTEYPICIEGERAAVPEDVGGILGYEDMLEILRDPEHEDYEDTILWLGEDFDPEYFDPKDVSF